MAISQYNLEKKGTEMMKATESIDLIRTDVMDSQNSDFLNGAMSEEWIKKNVFLKAQDFILSELHHSDLSSERIAQNIGVSRAVLYRAFTQMGGVKRYVDEVRLRKGFEVLQSRYEEPGIVNLVATSFGYENKLRFSRLFRARYHETPVSLVRRLRQANVERG